MSTCLSIPRSVMAFLLIPRCVKPFNCWDVIDFVGFKV